MIYDHEEEPRLMKMTDAQVEEARRVIAVQASTAPADGDLSPAGSLKRAEGVCGVDGRRLGDLGEPLGFPSLNVSRELRTLPRRRR